MVAGIKKSNGKRPGRILGEDGRMSARRCEHRIRQREALQQLTATFKVIVCPMMPHAHATIKNKYLKAMGATEMNWI